MASDILSEFNSNDVSHFKKDAMQMVKVGIEIDRYYGNITTLTLSFQNMKN